VQRAPPRYHCGVGLGRRSVSVHDASAWVFNRIATVYAARPAYPVELVDALVELAGSPDARIGDLGAGIGHLALPLAERGLDVTAIEPAYAMLARLRKRAAQRELPLRSMCATAEATQLPAASLELVLIADALHFLDVERTGLEVARVLVPRGALALLTCELGDTPFMRDVVRVMEEAAPRRPRGTEQARAQLSALTNVVLEPERRFYDETPVDAHTLSRILRSISFIGPAMNRERRAAFQARIRALPHAPIWARTLRLQTGRRRHA
jgi:ubiquinone/menaquinone biosynthesis C-methylase UbiE